VCAVLISLETSNPCIPAWSVMRAYRSGFSTGCRAKIQRYLAWPARCGDACAARVNGS
jgi:hypothetical protein